MKFERTFQYIDARGVVFNASQITLNESDRGRLRELHFGEAKKAHYQVNSAVIEMYDHMQARSLPCLMTVSISQPLSRQQADAHNQLRTTISAGAGAVVSGAVGRVATPYVGVPVGMAVRQYANKAIPTHHAGDVLVIIDAQVNGGIGPQHSSMPLIIEA